MEQKRRVIAEETLVENGHSPEETGSERMQRNAGESSQSARGNLTAINVEEIIQAYGVVLTESPPMPGIVADVARRPYSKSRIKRAILIALSTINDLAQKEPLKIGYIQLADFQEGIGSTDIGLNLPGIDLENASAEELAKEVLSQIEGSEDWQPLVLKKQEVLHLELQAAGYLSSGV